MGKENGVFYGRCMQPYGISVRVILSEENEEKTIVKDLKKTIPKAKSEL